MTRAMLCTAAVATLSTPGPHGYPDCCIIGDLTDPRFPPQFREKCELEGELTTAQQRSGAIAAGPAGRWWLPLMMALLVTCIFRRGGLEVT